VTVQRTVDYISDIYGGEYVTVFCNVTPCSLVDTYVRFGVTSTIFTMGNETTRRYILQNITPFFFLSVAEVQKSGKNRRHKGQLLCLSSYWWKQNHIIFTLHWEGSATLKETQDRAEQIARIACPYSSFGLKQLAGLPHTHPGSGPTSLVGSSFFLAVTKWSCWHIYASTYIFMCLCTSICIYLSHTPFF
jgi:hypothetical protein